MAEPLSEADLERIEANLIQLQAADEQAKKAIQAGIDVGDLKEQITNQRSQLLKLKQTYFPGK